MALNENHQRALLATLSHVDKLLSGVEEATRETHSPFSRTRPDLSPPERKVVLEHLAAIRSRLVQALEELGLPRPEPGILASWSIQTALSGAQVALADAAPGRLKGYGALDEDTAQQVHRIEADLDRSLQRLRLWISRRAAHDLGARLARLSDLPFDLETLRTLEQIVARHGLVEFRGALEAIAEHLEAQTVEIAFFGRVSSGKSSLLNVILEGEVLPVGVTPVTAVPTRIEAGEGGATVEFADAPSQEMALDRLSEFASEQGNPGNGKHVARIVVRCSSPRVPEGLVLVDTPGVGALAASGARASYDYLPRADVGVVLVDATGNLSGEDLDLLRLLLESGIQPMVVLSKADLISPGDRKTLTEYIRGEILRELEVEMPVQAVSALGPEVELAWHWFEHELAPLAERARAQVLLSAGRKLEAVREGVLALLKAGESRSGVEEEAARADEVARDAEVLLREAHERLLLLAEKSREITASAIARTAAKALRRREETPWPAPAMLRESLVEAAGALRTEVRGEVTATRERLVRLIERIRPGADVRERAGILALDLVELPELVLPEAVQKLKLSQPGWTAKFRGPAERRLADSIRAQAGEALEAAAADFGAALREFSRRALERLALQVGAEVEPWRTSTRSRVEDSESVEADIRRLERAAAGESPRAD